MFLPDPHRWLAAETAGGAASPGAFEQWPPALRTLFATLLASPQPALLWWGPEFTVLYNPAFRRLLGARHPAVMGRPGVQVWAAWWDRLGPALARVIAQGESVRVDDLMLDADRLALCCSPIVEADGRIGGVYCPVIEESVNEKALQATALRYRTLFDSMDEGYCIVRVLFDDTGRPHDYVFEEVNPAFVRQTDIRDAVGRSMREIAPDHETHWFETYGAIAMTGEPRRFTNVATKLGRWYDVHAFRIGQPWERRVAILFHEVTANRRAQPGAGAG